MAYNHGKAERRWRLWKEKEEKILRECGIDEETIEEIRTFDREEFNSDRRFYTRLNDEEVVLDEERAELLHRAINTLPEIQRRRFLLYYEYDYNCAEIGAMEHRSATAIAQSITRAREKVKTQMKKYLSA